MATEPLLPHSNSMASNAPTPLLTAAETKWHNSVMLWNNNNNHIHHYFNGSILIVEPVFMVIAGLSVGLLCGSVLTLEDRQQTKPNIVYLTTL